MENIFKCAVSLGHTISDYARQLSPLVVPSDSQLIEQAKSGDNEAFGALVKRHQVFVFKQAYAYLRNNDLAKDATQDVFIKVYEGLTYLENSAIFKSWVYQICKNHCLNLIRRNRVEIEFENLPEYDNQNGNVAIEDLLRRLITSLDESYQEVIILHYYQQLKYEEIAAFLGIPLSSVKIRLFRAKKTLKAMLENKKHDLR